MEKGLGHGVKRPPAGSIAKQRLQDTVSGIVVVHVTVPAKLARKGCAMKLGLAVDD